MGFSFHHCMNTDMTSESRRGKERHSEAVKEERITEFDRFAVDI